MIGTPTANRGRAELEGVIRVLCENTLRHCRVDLGGEPTVAEVLGQAKGQALAAQGARGYPVRAGGGGSAGRSGGLGRTIRQPRFCFAWQNAPGRLRGCRGWQGRRCRGPRRRAKFDLTLGLEEAGGGSSEALEYATALFERGDGGATCGYLHGRCWRGW